MRNGDRSAGERTRTSKGSRPPAPKFPKKVSSPRKIWLVEAVQGVSFGYAWPIWEHIGNTGNTNVDHAVRDQRAERHQFAHRLDLWWEPARPGSNFRWLWFASRAARLVSLLRPTSSNGRLPPAGGSQAPRSRWRCWARVSRPLALARARRG